MRSILFTLIFLSQITYADDDSKRYKAAKFYKQQAQSAVYASKANVKGDCQLMLTMHHIDQKYAQLKRIKYTGSPKVCKVAKRELKSYINKNIRYDITEKYLRIEVSRW
ncbi:hypothetical protein [Vibrio rumoiensis]|uniref:Uncharacterized protein n=1 Tax=Vibrio rumoiensis 1S-45 TaxID=1188252 RepID=A0A1E5E4E8_9VIBR|nr:hypothetical protein [Vibrio rumoiensis]OEF27636.1 hypothetical protein A1QC_06280 [Vibrio rumoiensis 1S-45]